MRCQAGCCWAVVFLALPLAVGCGCNSEEMLESVQKTATQVQESVTSTVDDAQTRAKEQLEMVGSSELTLDVPLKTPSCYAVFTPATNGRSSVLALQSYRAAEKESFPSFYLQASVSAATLSELVGQTVPAQMFVKPSADAATWHTTAAQPVQLKILSLENQQLKAEVAGGTLARSDSDETRSASGAFVAVLP